MSITNTETQTRLSVIDFSKQGLKSPSSEWDLMKAQVREALEEHGCFEASLDQLMKLREAVLGAVEKMFDPPLQTKQFYVFDKPFYC
ncbi:hypothetical protein V6N13_080537 [Hibiscus sabdariffa]